MGKEEDMHLLAFSEILLGIPEASKKRLAVRVTPAAERAVRSGHPWLFDQGIQSMSHAGKPGDLAVIFDRKQRFLGIGLYDPQSPIRVRMLHHGSPAQIDAGWFGEQLKMAVFIRIPLQETNTTGYRLVHGGNDGLEGVVIDRYDQTVVVKLYTAAWVPHLRPLLTALVHCVQPQRVVLRLSRMMLQNPELLYGLENGMVLYGTPLDGPVLFQENGLRFMVDVVQGQKTGFFLDQRDNRARVEQLAEGQSVLNVFAYTGGFSLYAARGGAAEVVSLDLSRPALEMAAQNFELNRDNMAVSQSPHELLAGDAFQELANLAENGRIVRNRWSERWVRMRGWCGWGCVCCGAAARW